MTSWSVKKIPRNTHTQKKKTKKKKKEEKEEEEEEFPKNVARAFGCLYAKKKDQTQTFYTN